MLSIIMVVVMCVSYVGALSRFSSLDIKFDFGNESTESEVFEESSETPEVSNAPLPVTYQYYDKLQFKDTKYKNSEVKNGSLALIKSISASSGEIGESAIVQSDVLNIYANMTPKVYGLANAGLTLYGDALRAVDTWLVWFNEDILPSNGLCIESAYCDAEDVSIDRKPIDLHSGFSVKLMLLNNKTKFTDKEFAALREQAHIYGIIQRYPEGKEEYTGKSVDLTQFRYVGLVHSDYMQRYKLSLEEYIDKIKTEKVLEFKARYEANAAYVVYYVSANGEGNSTDVPLPAGGEIYQISGDGSDGFIVSVKVSL